MQFIIQYDIIIKNCLGDIMPLRFVNKNIIKVSADVIVNPSDGINFKENNISKVITEAGGKAYEKALETINPINIGNVVFTSAGEMNYKYVAHVALPDWYGGKKNEREYLDSCYSEVLYMSDERKCKTIVFPVLGIGLYGMPYIDALNVAVRAIESYLTVKDSLNIFIATTDIDLFKYIKEEYAEYCVTDNSLDNFDEINTLDYKLSHLDYKFIDSLTHYMQRMEFTSVQCYTAAGIDKKLFSKIKNNPDYLPSKSTIIKFAFALHLSLAEAQQLLGTCGYILSDSIAEDVIIKHFLSQRIYEYEKLQEENIKRSL